jgi:hypothetical protein
VIVFHVKSPSVVFVLCVFVLCVFVTRVFVTTAGTPSVVFMSSGMGSHR